MVAGGVATHKEHVMDTVRHFLQTVVVMDDGAQYDVLQGADAPVMAVTPVRGGSERADLEDGSGEPRQGDTHDPAPQQDGGNDAAPQQGDDLDITAQQDGDDNADPRQGNALDAAALVDAFAEQGLVCGVLKPIDEQDTAARNRTLSAAKRADILILDWEIGQTQGTVACEIIKQVTANDNNERLRLIAIYTGCDGLGVIVTDIKNALTIPNGRYRPIDGQGDEQFAIIYGSCKIVVYAKDGVHTAGSRSIPETDLPNVLIDEFAALASGLLSNLAVASLGAIREHTHRILQRFGSDIDAAYLIHRALLHTPEDAEEQAVALVAAEIESLLEDSGVVDNVGNEAIQRWVSSHVNMVKPDDLPFPGDKDTAANFITAVVVGGVAGDNIKATYPQLDWLPETGKEPRARILPQLGKSVACKSGYNGNDRFGMLMTLHQVYGAESNSRYLRLGTISASESNGEVTYWICLQPSCDCLRLPGARSFLMLRTKVVGPEDDKSKYNLLLSDGDATIKLHVDEQVYNLAMFEFSPITGKDRIWALQDAAGKYFFHDLNGHTFRFVGELKRQHAQKIAQGLSNQLNRMGITTCEYLRLSGRK